MRTGGRCHEAAVAKNGLIKSYFDPARKLAGACDILCTQNLFCIVYVSCNPATLARDSEALVNADMRLRVYDARHVPAHSGHLESMVLFERM